MTERAAVRPWLVSGTGTGVGKTWVTRGLARALTRRGIRVAALKPIETGCENGVARDAIALENACRGTALAAAPGLHRGLSPVAPYAAELMGEPGVPERSALVHAVQEAAGDAELVLVEGAGGLLVPCARTWTIAELARDLDARLILVGEDRLGVLSAMSAVIEAARARTLSVGAVALVRSGDGDVSRATNARILEAMHGVWVSVVGEGRDDDDALADEIERAGLAERIAGSGR